MADIPSEFGRATRVVASGYARTRIHGSTLVRGEKRAFVVSLNGAMPKGVTIASARWQCDDGSVLAMSNARLSDSKRETAVDLVAAACGAGALQCTATLSTGEVLAQLATVQVLDWCGAGGSQTAAGATDLTATA